ncbi:MAG: hypothetical protein D6E12_09075 [Desulfovibrio sp.]|nr:MAG: hypothetical protein D6E12_09075 [Desulfovibrio sp.]
MVESYEVVAWVIATGVLTILVMFREELKLIPHAGPLKIAFLCMYIGLMLTILEGFTWFGVLNTLEHIFNFASAVAFVFWVYLVTERGANKT